MTVGQSVADALRWYLVLTVVAAAVYPVVFYAARGLSDRGWSLARPLGLLIAVGITWWPAAVGVLPFTNVVIIVGIAVVAVAGWAHLLVRRSLARFLAERWRWVLVVEVASLAIFVGYVIFRGFNPAVAYTEKPMDLAFLSSAIRTRAVPPPDPWFAGQPINYYYLGYLMMGVLARLSGTTPGVAFNLSLATLFASATVAVGGVAANISRLAGGGRARTLAAAALGPLFLVGVGNLKTPWVFLHNPQGTLAASWWEGVGWGASRVIVDTGIPGSSAPHPTINEFPAFSFVLGDLHPHVLALPIFISAIGLAVGLVALCQSGRRLREDVLPLAAAGAVGGALYVINSWDMPTALVIAAGAILLTRHTAWRANVERIALLAASAIIAALPFALRYVPSVGSNAALPAPIQSLPILATVARTIGVVVWAKSALGPLLEVHGLFLAIMLVAIGAVWAALPSCRRPNVIAAMAISGGTLLVADLLGFPALVLFGLPGVFLAVALTRDWLPEPLRFPGWLFALGCLLVLVVEVFYLQDAFGDRMNTVFKVYFQVWSIFSVASAAALPVVLPALARRLGTPAAWASGALVGVLVLGAALYPPLSAFRWDNGFASWQGIDGLSYVATVDSAEAAGIAWLSAHAGPGSVVLEAPGCSYGIADGLPQDRVSMATGIPTVIGWNFHEYQWRDGTPSQLQEIRQREQAVNQIYRDPTSPAARQALSRYHVTYIYVGSQEERGSSAGCTVGPPYPAASLAQIPHLGWPVVFRQGDVTIYQRPS